MKKRRRSLLTPAADPGATLFTTTMSRCLPRGSNERPSSVLPQKYHGILEASPLLNVLAPALREELIAMGTLRRWHRGDTLYRDGDPIQDFFFLFSGKVREFYCAGSGSEFLRRLVQPGGYVALHTIFNRNTSHTNSCDALVATVAFTWPVAPFIDCLHRHPSLGVAVAAALSQSYEQVCRRHCLCRKPTARCRVAGYLLSRICLDCAHSCDRTVNNHIHCLDLSPLSIAAEEVHLARETFSRALIALQEEGIITCSRGTITIRNIMALRTICDIE